MLCWYLLQISKYFGIILEPGVGYVTFCKVLSTNLKMRLLLRLPCLTFFTRLKIFGEVYNIVFFGVDGRETFCKFKQFAAFFTENCLPAKRKSSISELEVEVDQP